MDINWDNPILISFAGTLLAVLLSLIVWIVKRAFDKHEKAVLALIRLERDYAINNSTFGGYQLLMEQWIGALEKGIPFTGAFGGFRTSDAPLEDIDNLKVINQVMGMNNLLRNLGEDVKNTYDNYSQRVNSYTEGRLSLSEQEWKDYSSSLANTLETGFLKHFPGAQDDIYKCVAYIRDCARIRKHSLFGYISKLNIDIFPRITEKSIQKQISIIKDRVSAKNIDNDSDI